MPQSNSPHQREPKLPHSDPAQSPTSPGVTPGDGRRLHSWKEISAYLGRDPRTAQRWEKFERLPVHRQVHGEGGWGSVYAFTSEIDAWRQSRSRAAAISEEATPEEHSSSNKEDAIPWHKRLWLFAVLGLLAVLAAGLLYFKRTGPHSVLLKPVSLSSLPVEQLAPSFSPDGKSVVFAVGNESGKRFQVYVKSIAGSSERQISSGPALSYSPAWSPDGKTIAYLSGVYGGDASLWLVSPDGTKPRKLRDIQSGVWPWNRGLAWTPDSQALIAIDTLNRSDSTALFRIGLDGTKRRITSPPSRSTDAFPSVSFDGKLLVFSRFSSGVTRLYEQRLDASGQPPRLICAQLKDVVGPSAVWLGSTGELLVGTEHSGAGQLWRIRPFGEPVLLTYVSNSIIDVAASREGDRAAFALRRSDANMWTLPLPSSAGVANPTRDDAITSTRDEYNGQYSPDGTRIAFESDRSGSPEIWTSGANGQNTLQLTRFEGPVTGSPHWSPDSKWLVFDSRVNGHAAIFVAPAQRGASKRITVDDGPNVVPSWSHDGKWIYFASNRTGRHEVWRVHPDGSDPIQLTHRGGFYAEDAPNGKTIYYTKRHDSVTSLWQIDFDGSNEREIAAPVLDRCFAVASRGVYFASAPTPAASPVLRFLAFGSRNPVEVTRLPRPIMYGLAVSPGGRELLFGQLDTRAVELMIVNGPFR
jgi:Tol biopolymer transport system component